MIPQLSRRKQHNLIRRLRSPTQIEKIIGPRSGRDRQINKQFQACLPEQPKDILVSFQDPRFNNEIDRRTGYTTNSILCVPINSYEGEVIGVAQIINKTDGTSSFTDRDIEVSIFYSDSINVKRLYDGTYENRKHWQDLAEKVEMGLTWIDHDKIEKPIEEFADAGGTKDIEFTVTTLNCDKIATPDSDTSHSIGGSITPSGSTSLHHNRTTRFVALECLSYHATASGEDTRKLIKDTIPSAQVYNLYSFTFIDFDLSDMDTCRATIRMFLECDLVKQFHIPYDVLCRWVLSVKKNYRPVKYHNWRHALNVAQTMFAMLKTGKMERFMSDLEILGLLVACLCHDLDHRGTNNAFQTKTESPLAILYTTSTMEHHHFDQCVMILNSGEGTNNAFQTKTESPLAILYTTSTMEHHHFDQCVMILNSDGNNIFQALSPHDYRIVMKLVENSILSTDLAMYFKKKNRFIQLVENGEFDWQSEEKKQLLCGMMMTACDVGAIAKPWEVQHKMAKLVADEFFDQGDLEKLQLNTQPVAMMDRERKDELPQMQVGFIDVICLPLYKVMSDTFPWIQPLYDGTYENRKHWQDLAEKVEMGLTWIDHDKIEKPIEEFADAGGTKDIEFTVTTLNCDKIATPDSDTSHSIGGSITPSGSTSLHHNRTTRFASLRRNKQLGKSVRSKFTRSFYHSNNSHPKDKDRELSNLSTSRSDDIHSTDPPTPHSRPPSVLHTHQGGTGQTQTPLSTPDTPSSPPKRKLCRNKNRTCLLF
ncbi:cGMP-specific 3',5'-cyclic phosphodiesterase-like [Diaphorina citri]|uniref:Phosphodiesterase n=1 Tax=Diaphorina citri TaxID=121845 RepID=A0A3Q0JJH3_DIACI|nr:cGMP-specific 3',5'-cyclic phosphodiesterase-like [Diaphorina citri]